jgi:uncharacterized protein (DUF2267 family)
MSNHLEIIDTTVQKTYEWLRDVREELHTEDNHQAYQALRAVLHSLRDRLPVEEAVDLGAQFPMLIRGIYYEGWKPTGKPVKARTQEEFFAMIAGHLWSVGNVDPDRYARAVFAVLDKHVTGGEMHQVRSNLPQELQNLWTRATAEV